MSFAIPRAPMQPLERVLLDEVALDGILEVVAPVQLDRAGDVALVVEIRVLVDLRDDEPCVAEVLGEPLRRRRERASHSRFQPSLLPYYGN